MLLVLDQKEETDFRHKLNVLDKQYRYTQKMLKQRQDDLLKEHRKVVMVKVCEPKATVHMALNEIHKHMTVTHVRGIHKSDGRMYSSELQCHRKKSALVEKTQSILAPPSSNKSICYARQRSNIQFNLSLMQMKTIVTIDSISEKELVRQKQKEREEMEKLRQLHRETLQKRVTTFIKSLKDK